MMEAAVLPESWCVATLNDIAHPFGGSTPSKSDASFWTDGTVPWVSPKDMKVFELRGSEDLVSEKALTRLSLIPEGSILVVVRSGILSRILPVAINHLPVTINQDMRAFVPAPEISARFIAWQLLANQREILGKCSKDGTTVASIEAVALASYPFALPPATEQHRIVAKIEELFSELDQGVASLKTAREQLKVYRQSLLKNAFEGKLTAAWRSAHRDQLETAAALQQRIARERQARYQQQLADWQTAGQAGPKPKAPKPLPPLTAEELAELPELPAGWGWTRLGQLFNVFVGSTPSRKRDDFWGGAIPWVSSGEVAFCRIKDTKEKISVEGFANASTELHPPGTVMLAMIGEGKTRGQAAILDVAAAHNQNTAAIRVSEAGCSPEFVYQYLVYQYEITRKIGSGNNQKALNKERVSELLLPLCGLDEMAEVVSKIDEKLSEADQLDQTLATALQQADALRQSILKKAFHGQLVKQDKNEEPATALLERIRAARATSPAKGRQAKMVSKPLANC